jgi:hypothetical protein
MNRKILSIVAATLLIGTQASAHADAGAALRAEVAERGHVAVSQIREQARAEVAVNTRALLPQMAAVTAAAAQITDVAAMQAGR